MVFFIQCKNCMSVEKISLESGKLSVFKVHFILSVAKLYYYCCELARRVSLGCKWPHITTRDRLFAILASEKKCIHFACLESFHENKTFKVLKIRGNSGIFCLLQYPGVMGSNPTMDELKIRI